MSLSLNAPGLAHQLQQGSAVIFPTDTLPALASRPEHAACLWNIKQRPQHKPVILMGDDPGALFRCLGYPIQPEWQAMAKRHWPGALTLVLPAQGSLIDQLNPGGDCLGLRIPACAEALELLQLTGPLATTSANRSGEPPCLDAAAAARQFPAIPRLGPKPWPIAGGTASTVLRWEPSGQWQVLRAGAVMPDGIAE